MKTVGVRLLAAAVELWQAKEELLSTGILIFSV
jgi:hypothetical protein